MLEKFRKKVIFYQFIYFSILFLYFFPDWFPGWTRNYGAEPSSLTPSEDCVALRQSFPGLGPDAVALTSVEAKDVRGDNFSL